MAIKTIPMIRPGSIPARNSAPIDAFDTRAYSTIGIEGGIMGPIVADAAVIAAA